MKFSLGVPILVVVCYYSLFRLVLVYQVIIDCAHHFIPWTLFVGNIRTSQTYDSSLKLVDYNALVVTIVSYLALESVFRLFRDSIHPENTMHNDNMAKYLIMSHLTS